MEEKLYPVSSRRLRLNAQIRSLVSPLRLNHQSFILPLFVDEGLSVPRFVQNMGGVQVETKETIFLAIENALKAGITKFLLFPVPAHKKMVPDDFSFAENIVNSIKNKFSNDIWLAADVCLCSYTRHGHCGLLDSTSTYVDNDTSVALLTQYALKLAQSGVDCVAPSDMMDGRIKSIRNVLNHHGMDQTTLMSYSTKFNSSLYGPFRDACHSAPASDTLKDRKSYQLSSIHALQAIQTSMSDEQDGADILMVKPSSMYMDIIYRIKQTTRLPLAAYHVSGEYAMIESLAALGGIDRQKAHLELWISLHRAGADIIISYAAIHAKEWISTFEY